MMPGGGGWDGAVTPGKGAGPGARDGHAETRGGDGYRGGGGAGGGAHGGPGAHSPYGRSPGFSPQGSPMGPGPPITAMAIADAIFDEIRNSGTDVKKPESTRPHGVAPHPQLPRSNTKTKRTKPKRRRRRRRASVPTVDRTPRHSLTSSRSRSRAPLAVTDRQLELLAFVFDAKHLENSLVMYQKRAVKKLVAVKSGRTCWQVRGKSGAKEEYLVFPTHYCSCRAFQWDVLSKGEQLICKHMLAVRIAEALDDYNVAEIDDALLAQLLEAYANDAGDGGGGTRRGPSRRGGGGNGGRR